MANDIVWFDSTETGMPALTNAAGSLDSVLNACLVTGVRPLTLDSITVASNVATATYSAGHGYSDKRMVDIGGAATGSINGRKLITVTGANTFTFPAPGVSDGTISGTLTAKRSPLGWTRPLNSGNVSIYQRSDVAATPQRLRIDDSGSGVASATEARVRMIEAYTDLNTFTGPCPTDAQVSNGGYWIKGANSGTSKRWLLCGDSRFFYLFVEGIGTSFASSGGLLGYGFGDPIVTRDTAYDTFIACGNSGGETPSGLFNCIPVGGTPSSNGLFWSRSGSQLGGAVRGGIVGASTQSSVMGGGSQPIPVYPSNIDNGGSFMTPAFMCEENSSFSNPIRGSLPGLSYPMFRGLHLQHGTLLPDIEGTDRMQLVVGLMVPSNSSQTGAVILDVTGPWR